MGEDIICSVAHVLFRVDGRLTVKPFERLLLLLPSIRIDQWFRNRRAADLLAAISAISRPRRSGRCRTGRESSLRAAPWKKAFTAGSDDHSGLTGRGLYGTPLASNVDEYLASLRRGEHEADGDCGGSVLMGHAFYHIAYSYYQDRFIRGNTR